MNATELNAKAQELLDAIWGPISEFQAMRNDSGPVSWDTASEARSRWLDKLCEIENVLES